MRVTDQPAQSPEHIWASLGISALAERYQHQKKGHQQALVAWQASKEATAKLAQQAKRLATRLLELAQPQRLAAWAHAHLRRERPYLFANWERAFEAQRARRRIADMESARDAEKRLASSAEKPELDTKLPAAKTPVQVWPERAGPDRAPLKATNPHTPGPGAEAPVAPPKRDWNRYKALQKELADKGRQSLQDRGVLRTEKDAPERDPPEIKKDRGSER